MFKLGESLDGKLGPVLDFLLSPECNLCRCKISLERGEVTGEESFPFVVWMVAPYARILLRTGCWVRAEYQILGL